MRIIQAMYYDQVSICQVALTIKPVERSNKASGNKYYLAEFSYKVLPEEEVLRTQEVVHGVPLWREDTLTGDAVVELQENYSPPGGLKAAA